LFYYTEYVPALE